MPRPVRACGRPGTRVIPEDWAASHRPVLAGTRTAVVTLRHPGTTGQWDRTKGARSQVPHPPYTPDLIDGVPGGIPARVQALTTDARQAEAGEDVTTVAGYQITVDISQAGDEVAVDDIATVTGTGDPLLDGRDLAVEEIVRGSLLFERVLLCTLTD